MSAVFGTGGRAGGCGRVACYPGGCIGRLRRRPLTLEEPQMETYSNFVLMDSLEGRTLLSGTPSEAVLADQAQLKADTAKLKADQTALNMQLKVDRTAISDAQKAVRAHRKELVTELKHD